MEKQQDRIRIKDIAKGQANQGTAWISAEVSSRVAGSWKLRAGDVLFSKSGTIGKVGIVRNGAVGAVAASGFYVIRTDGSRLDPHFLTAYLHSSDCRAWIKDRSSGSAISHVTRRIIEEIPVPLPPLQIQQRVSAEWREHGVDVIAYLVQLLTHEEYDSIAEWVENGLKLFQENLKTESDPLDFSQVDQWLSTIIFAQIEAKLGTHGGFEDSILQSWLNTIEKAVAPIRGITHMPSGPGLLSILQEAIQEIEKSKAAIKGHMPMKEKLEV